VLALTNLCDADISLSVVPQVFPGPVLNQFFKLVSYYSVVGSLEPKQPEERGYYMPQLKVRLKQGIISE